MALTQMFAEHVMPRNLFVIHGVQEFVCTTWCPTAWLENVAICNMAPIHIFVQHGAQPRGYTAWRVFTLLYNMAPVTGSYNMAPSHVAAQCGTQEHGCTTRHPGTWLHNMVPASWLLIMHGCTVHYIELAPSCLIHMAPGRFITPK